MLLETFVSSLAFGTFLGTSLFFSNSRLISVRVRTFRRPYGRLVPTGPLFLPVLARALTGTAHGRMQLTGLTSFPSLVLTLLGLGFAPTHHNCDEHSQHKKLGKHRL